MLILRRARIPSALLPPGLAALASDPLDPSVTCDVTVDGSRIASVTASGAKGNGTGGLGKGGLEADGREADSLDTRSLDLEGSMVLPGFIDAHVHLDKTHTWERAPNRSGTFAEALETLRLDRVNWTAPDIHRRAGFALRCAWENGTRVIRTHVDTGLPWAETSHAAMAELRSQWRGRIALQTVSLCGIAAYSEPGGEGIADLALRHGASALGGWSLLTPGLPGQVERLMTLAAERGVGLDLHVDENGDPKAEVLRTVAEAVLRTGFPHPVACGHCCSLAVQAPARQRSTIALVKEAGIRVISLPMCNLYLQDRRTSGFPRTPSWRGVTLIHEFLDAGVPVACASDNVRDAFHPFGDYDALEVHSQGLRIAHLDSRLAESVALVTSSAADIVGLPDHGRVAPGAAAHLVVLPARSFSEILSRPGGPRRLVDGEEIRDGRPPGYGEL